MAKNLVLIFLFIVSCSSPTSTVVVEENSPVVQGKFLDENIGFESLGGILTPILKKGCKLPCEVSEVFSTADDNQNEISIKIVRGSDVMANKGKDLGLYKISGISPATRGKPRIEIIFKAIKGSILLSVHDKDNKSNLKLDKVK